MRNRLEEDYKEAIGIVSTFIEDPPLTRGEARTLYALVQEAHQNNARTLRRECILL